MQKGYTGGTIVFLYLNFGKVGREFVSELSRLYLAYGTSSILESIALKAATVFPILMLQKPSKQSKTKHHIHCLERHLTNWFSWDLKELLKEGRTLQQCLPQNHTAHANSTLARKFANLMFAEKCKTALDLLLNSQKGSILHLHDHSDTANPSSRTVRNVWISKHPPPQPVNQDCILQEEPEVPHFIIFEALDASAIRLVALKATGAAGPSGLDGYEWRRLCTSHKGASRDLCESLASVARRICSSYVDPIPIAPLLAFHLIALDKCPGIHPIGIDDTVHRIISKAVLTIMGPDIQQVTGHQQMCGGHISGVEAAVHATRFAFESEESEAAILVDATNAFNALNRQVTLQNIRRLCPIIATILINTYQSPTDLYVDGDVILSQEGTTQGDPLAMPMYGLVTIPLIRRLGAACKQVWYADDFAAVGKIHQL